MASTFYIIHYSNSTGFVLGMWRKVSSSNHTTAIADGKLTIDGVDVLAGIGDRSDLLFAEITNPTDSETSLQTSVLEVDDLGLPTDVMFRTDEAKNPDYDFPMAP